jgi:hypothetical protein
MSGYIVTPVQRDVYVLLKAFLVTVTGLDPSLVIQGLPNRSAMPPASPGFVSMQLSRLKQLRTPEETWDYTDVAPTEIAVEQGTELRCQLDLYGAASGDWGAMLQTLLRDETGCIALAGADPTNPVCQPLYASDAQLVTLDDSESQYEDRWTIEAILQYNPVTSVPMQFADTLELTVINVDEAYPP